MNPQQMRQLVDQYIDGYNNKDLQQMLKPLSHDVEFTHYNGTVVAVHTNTREALRELATQSLNLFSERRQTITDFSIDDQRATAQIAYRAVVAQDLENGWKQGQVLEMQGRSEFCFKDGLICQIADFA